MAASSAKAISKSLSIYFVILLLECRKSKERILASTCKLAAHPEMYPSDKYRKNNDGSFRAYELHRYRIAYRVTAKEIIIVRVRHTSMEPKEY